MIFYSDLKHIFAAILLLVGLFIFHAFRFPSMGWGATLLLALIPFLSVTAPRAVNLLRFTGKYGVSWRLNDNIEYDYLNSEGSLTRFFGYFFFGVAYLMPYLWST